MSWSKIISTWQDLLCKRQLSLEWRSHSVARYVLQDLTGNSGIGSGLTLPINIINNIIGIPSYSLAFFVSEYLWANWSELVLEELYTQEKLEKSTLSGSTIRSDVNINWRAEIRSRTACQWLNRLVYKWKELQKNIFFYRREQKNVVEYRETFLSEMKSLLPYFVEFSDDRSILPKVYPNDCTVKGSD